MRPTVRTAGTSWPVWVHKALTQNIANPMPIRTFSRGSEVRRSVLPRGIGPGGSAAYETPIREVTPDPSRCRIFVWGVSAEDQDECSPIPKVVPLQVSLTSSSIASV